MAQPRQAESEQWASANAGAGGEVSLVRGGPFYRAQAAARLLDCDRWNLGRRVIFAVAIGWLPLVLLTLAFNPRTALGLLTDYPINARMLVGVPVLLAGQLLMESAFRTILRHIRDAALLTPSDADRLDKTLVTLIRLRDSVIPELVIVLAVYARVAQMVQSHLLIARPRALIGTGAEAHLSGAGWYYALVSQLLYQFLLGISLWKWLLWWVFLFRLSKLDLQLVPTHPDHHGGVGFLGMSPLAIAPTVFVAAAAIGGTWRAQILRQGVHLMSFKFDAIFLLAIVLLVALGPLVFFVPKLARLRRQGILQYGMLAQLHSTEFHKKWILGRAGHEEDFLAAPEVSTLTDYASSYQNIEDLKPFPFDRGAFVALILAIAIPILPVVLAEIPFAEVLKGLLSAAR
jgi:hypothetical protein